MPEIALPASPLSDGVIALRPWRADDVPALVEAAQDPEIPRWTVVPAPYGEADARGFIAAQSERRASGDAAPFAVVSAPDDRLLGSVEITLQDWRNARGEIGYWIAGSARRRGAALRSVQLISRWAFDALGLARIELLVEPPNTASQRVAERAGYTREGVLRSYREMKGKRVDFVLFSLLPDDEAARG